MLKPLVAALLVLTPASVLAQSKVAFLMDKDVNAFTRRMITAVEEAAAKDPSIAVATLNAASDPGRQVQQVRDAIARKVDAIILRMVDDAAGKAAADLAAAAGVRLVYVNKRPPPEQLSGDAVVVSSNDLVAGRLQMRLLAAAVGGRGRVAILRGDDGNASLLQRVVGMREVLAGQPQLTLVANESAHWSRDEARRIVSAWLAAGPPPDIVAACNDDMALGAIDAVKAAGLAGKVAIGGIDGSPAGLAAVKAGEMVTSIYQNAPAIAAEAVAAAARLSRGEYTEQYDWVPYEVIVAGNVDDYARRP